MPYKQVFPWIWLRRFCFLGKDGSDWDAVEIQLSPLTCVLGVFLMALGLSAFALVRVFLANCLTGVLSAGASY
ncbi:hypothetical protein OAN307_c11060 [Octadecabacter antarcticus 307]|uniref:Uncharacterized protein n=1 Tax=Octadecabacter antarcticus 307 TaxID=391626 RepID=M9R904_9RHOB|nr:hypothetical protein OAN307_c11060 [Octadecabacter antarcticus 307]